MYSFCECQSNVWLLRQHYVQYKIWITVHFEMNYCLSSWDFKSLNIGDL